MSIIKVRKLNEVFMEVIPDENSIALELSDFFSFNYPNAKYQPRVRKRIWNGVYYLYDKKRLYTGLLPYLMLFAKDRHYDLDLDSRLILNPVVDRKFIRKWVDDLDLHGNDKNPIKAEDFQINGIMNSINSERRIIVSPTGSGKSLMMYCLTRWYLEKGKKCIIIVPTTTLVEQLYKDFTDYSYTNKFNTDENIQKLYSGFSKNFTKNVLITTWQSVYKEPRSWFSQFDMVIGDEAHGFKSRSLTAIMRKMDNIKYRIGTTGTMDNIKVHKLILEGLFGTVNSVATIKYSTEIGRLSKLKLTCLMLNYKPETKELMCEQEYQKEMDFIIEHKKRNDFICKLACDIKGNTLVLFNYVERHGVPLYNKIKEILKKKNIDKNVYFISGRVVVDERENIRKIANDVNNCIIVASYGTFSTGVNIPSIENIIFAHPYKSKIRNLQSIGRGLRVKEGKTHCNLYDIGDDFRSDEWLNYSFRHALERYKIYCEEKFIKRYVEVNIE